MGKSAAQPNSRMMWLLGLLFLFSLAECQYLKLNLHRHQSCPWKKGSGWHRKIEFEGGHDGNGATLQKGGQAGCYHIKGSVRVLEDIRDELLLFLSVSTTGDTARPPEQCRDPHPETGCGGVGSCLYCRPCDSLEGIGKVLGAQLVVQGKPIGCEPLKKGFYDDVELRFCLPPLAALLEWQGISEKALDRILAATTQDAHGGPKLSLFVTVYVFDKNVKPLIVSQRKLENRIKELRHLGPDDQLDSQTFWNLPFNQLLKKQQQYVGCHKLHGTVSLSEKQL